MTPEQFDLIVDTRFSRLSKDMVMACRAVTVRGLSAYQAENTYSCSRGTVSRNVNKIYAELAYCEEVISRGNN